MITILSKRGISWDEAYNSGMSDASTRSGMTVNEQTALGIPALWCGLRTISEAVGSLPLITYRKTDQGRERAEDHPLYPVLHDEPNPEMTAPVFREGLMFCALLYGNAYAEIERDNGGRPVSLWPIHPNRVSVTHEKRGQRQYVITQDDGEITLNPENVLHVPGLQDGTGLGFSLLKQCRETLGYSLAVSSFGSSWFGNAARPSGVLTTAGQLADTSRENLRKSWEKLHSGPDRAGKVALLEEGLTFTPITGTNEQSQYTEVMTFLVGEVARLLNLSPAKLMDLAGTSQYGTLETLQTSFVQDTLRPWLVKFESEYNRKLIGMDERGTIYTEHLVDALLRGDRTARNASYATALQNGWMTVEEVRERENLPPLPKPEAPEAAAPGAAPAPDAPADQGAEQPVVADVASTALNGAQIASLLEILAQVTAGQMPLDSAVAVLKASFPTLSESTINDIIGPLKTFTPEAPAQETNGTTPDQQPV